MKGIIFDKMHKANYEFLSEPLGPQRGFPRFVIHAKLMTGEVAHFERQQWTDEFFEYLVRSESIKIISWKK